MTHDETIELIRLFSEIHDKVEYIIDYLCNEASIDDFKINSIENDFVDFTVFGSFWGCDFRENYFFPTSFLEEDSPEKLKELVINFVKEQKLKEQEAKRIHEEKRKLEEEQEERKELQRLKEKYEKES